MPARAEPVARVRTTRSWAVRLTRNVTLLAVPSAVVWLAITPSYNLFLTKAAERLTRLGERTAVTQIALSEGQDGLVVRSDTRARGRLPYGVHLSDIHFHLVLILALFLAIPEVPWRDRLVNLGYALLVAVCFDVVDLFFWVKFIYATQLGDWSFQHYGVFARNAWGLGKHLLDLPVKLGLPFALWAFFYLGKFTGAPRTGREGAEVPSSGGRRRLARRRR